MTFIPMVPRTGALDLRETSEAGEASVAIGPESAMALAPRTSTAADARSVTRAERAASDHAATERAGRLIGGICTPEAFLYRAQAWARDVQAAVRQECALSSMARVEIDSAVRELQQQAAQEAEQNADVLSDVARGFAIAAAALATLASIVSCIVTGPAGALVAAGLAIAVLGPLICGELQRSGDLDATAALVISTVCTAVGTALSFGAGAAAGALGSVATAGNALSTGASIGSAGAQAVQAGSEMGVACYQRDAADRMADASEADCAVDRDIDQLEEDQGEIATLFRRFARIAEILQQAAAARGQALSAAAGARV